jgi:hypothetical protein
MSAETKHATGAQIVAISAAFDASAETKLARAVAVHAALKAGTDVKTLAADMVAAAALPGSKVIPVGQAMLGYAKAVSTIAAGLGVSLDDLSPAQAADWYDAAHRQGVGPAVKAVVAAGLGGKTPAAKVARATKAAAAEVARAKADRKAPTKAPRTTRPAGESAAASAAKVIRGIAGSLASGKLTADDDLRSAVAALAEALTVAKVAPSPAKVAAAVAAK